MLYRLAISCCVGMTVLCFALTGWAATPEDLWPVRRQTLGIRLYEPPAPTESHRIEFAVTENGTDINIRIDDESPVLYSSLGKENEQFIDVSHKIVGLKASHFMGPDVILAIKSINLLNGKAHFLAVRCFLKRGENKEVIIGTSEEEFLVTSEEFAIVGVDNPKGDTITIVLENRNGASWNGVVYQHPQGGMIGKHQGYVYTLTSGGTPNGAKENIRVDPTTSP